MFDQPSRKIWSSADRPAVQPVGRHDVQHATSNVQFMRQLLALPALADADPDRLAQLITPLFRQLVDPEPVTG